MIKVDTLWRENSTGDLVEVHWVSDELVSYTKDEKVKTVRTVRHFVFLQDFTQES